MDTYLDQRLVAELRRWQGAEPGRIRDGFDLAYLVASRIRRVGRAHLGDPLLTELAEIQARHRGYDPYLDAFLDAVLARRQERFGTRPTSRCRCWR